MKDVKYALQQKLFQGARFWKPANPTRNDLIITSSLFVILRTYLRMQLIWVCKIITNLVRQDSIRGIFFFFFFIEITTPKPWLLTIDIDTNKWYFLSILTSFMCIKGKLFPFKLSGFKISMLKKVYQKIEGIGLHGVNRWNFIIFLWKNLQYWKAEPFTFVLSDNPADPWNSRNFHWKELVNLFRVLHVTFINALKMLLRTMLLLGGIFLC